MRVRDIYLFYHFLTVTYVVVIRENRLNETVLLITQNTCIKRWVSKQVLVSVLYLSTLNNVKLSFLINLIINLFINSLEMY